VHLIRRPLVDLLYQPRMMDDECGAVGGVLGKGSRSTRRKPAPMPLCQPQILHDITRARTRVAADHSVTITFIEQNTQNVLRPSAASVY
jgi:hypothetical protein